MGWGSASLSSRPFNAGAQPSRYLQPAADKPENGWAAWVYSKQAKLNAWGWHGLGVDARSKVLAWASIGNSVYLRRDNEEAIYVMRPDVFLTENATNDESLKVYAETQWLDFGKPGMTKGISGMDFDGMNIEEVQFFMSVDGNRSGALVLRVPLSQDGWTYSGGIIPVELASTEFKMRFVGASNTEVQVNRLTIYWEDLGDQ